MSRFSNTSGTIRMVLLGACIFLESAACSGTTSSFDGGMVVKNGDPARLPLGAAASGGAQNVRLFVSSKAGDRMAEKPELRWGIPAPGADGTFTVDESITFQRIDGFGASFLEAGLICINSLPAEKGEDVLRALFDPETGAGFTAMKTVIAGTDFMSAGPWYTYADEPGDVKMEKFSIARDLGPNGLVTFIKRARRYGKFMLQAPMDYPPDWMLTEVNDRRRQDVDPKYFDALALYYLRYLREYEKQGIAIDYLSLFNEPGIYTKIPYDKIRILIRDHVGPLFKREGVKTKIQLSEACTRVEAAERYPTVLDDPGARAFVACIPYHGYDLKNFDKIRRLHERYPDLPLWMTEICHAYQAGTPKSMPLPRLDFEDGDFWGAQIVSDLEAGASAWIYWNMVLDQDGGPCLVSEVHGNPPNNVQHPVVVIDRKTGKVTYTGLYWYLAHFSRFVRPGSVRVATAGSIPGVRCIAFRREDGTVVVQLLNRSDQARRVVIAGKTGGVEVSLPAISISTCMWKSGAPAERQK